MFVDLDDLKAVNDNFGHLAGDHVITSAVAGIVLAVVQEAFVARIGGDEFVILLPGESNRNSVAAIAERLIKIMSREYEVLGQRILSSGSLGVAIYPDDGDTVEEILKKADNALYAAKSSGRNCWRFFESSLLEDKYERMTLTHSLRRALYSDELFLHYQPMVEVASGKIIGFEALLRWQSPEHGLVPPDRFIPLAEQSALILPLGKWVLRQACQFARRLGDLGRKDLHVAVNISPRQLSAADFVELIRTSVDAAGIAPAQLEIEVTESVLIDSLEDSVIKLTEIRNLGVRLSLDDFGVGFSSLTYLRKLPFRTLKVDKSFIHSITGDDTQARFVGHIIAMAHTLGLIVVAEGVEFEAQWLTLKQYNCNHIQGYFFSRPISEEAAIKFLHQSEDTTFMV